MVFADVDAVRAAVDQESTNHRMVKQMVTEVPPVAAVVEDVVLTDMVIADVVVADVDAAGVVVDQEVTDQGMVEKMVFTMYSGS